MCNNVFKWFLRAFAVVAALTVTSCADSPDEGDIVIPSLSLSVDGTTVDKGSAATMTFDEGGGTKQFSIKTTGEWEIEGRESAPQNFALTTSKGEEKYTGKGDETFTVTLGEATTAKDFMLTVKVYASIFGQKKVAGTRTIKIMQIKGGVMPDGTVFYFNNFDKEAAPSEKPFPYLDEFEGWKNQEGEGAAEVTYDFKSVSARANSKSDSNHSNYAGSGVTNLLFGNGGYFTIQNIAVSKTDLQLTFGTERFVYDEEDNTFKNEEFLVTLSADGQSWSAPIAYTFEEGVDTNGKWNLAKADFTLPDGTTTLYIKFATTIASAHRIDDVKLTDGIGGQAISFDGGGDTPTPPTPGDGTTVADLVAMCKAAGSTQTALDEANDVVVEAVIVTDKDGGNTTPKNLMIMAEGATEAGNGVMLYGSGITDPTHESFTWKSGDKVKVTLKAGQARACIFNGTYEITGSKNAEWIAIEKIGTATITPVELTTVDNLADYQSMVVTVKDATSPATAAEWCTADANKTHTFTVGGSNLTVYVRKNAAAFVGKPFKASTTGDITGVVTLYQNAAQLAPRTADDVKAFNGEGGGDEPTPPTPAEGGVATYTPSEMGYADKENVSSATLNDGAVTLAFAGGSPAPIYYTNGTSLRCYAQSTITVKSDAKISKIVVTRGANDKGNKLTASVGTLSEDTLTWTGESNEVVLTVDGTSGHIRIVSMEITYGESGGDQPDQPDQPVVGNTASLTLDDIAKSGPRSYKEFSITAADGSIWTGYCSGSADRLQMGWNTDTTKDASKSYVLVPDADKVINKITFTPEGGTTNNRVLALLPVDFTYTGQSADEVKKAAYAYSANTVKGSTEPLSIDLTGKNLKRFMIRAVGGAVYLTNITIEYAE